MLAVGLGPEDVLRFMPDSESGVVIACENSPNSVTLSGQMTALHDIKKQLDREQIFARELKTGKAYHSPQMEGVSHVYNKLLSDSIELLNFDDLAWRQPRSRMISSVTGFEIFDEHLGVSYWSDNLRRRVRFSSAVSTLGAIPDMEDVNCVIEIGPHSALSGPFKQICIAHKLDRFTYIPTLVRNIDDASQLLFTAGSLFLAGYPLDLEAVNAIEPQNRTGQGLKCVTPLLLVDLPPYQWNYDKRYWAEPRPSAEQRSLNHLRHDILGSKVTGQ